MDCNKMISAGVLSVSLKGKCTFADSKYTKQIFSDLENPELSDVRFELKGLDFIDSSGLGMLMMFKEKAEEKKISMALLHPQGQVKKMLEVAKLSKIFTIID